MTQREIDLQDSISNMRGFLNDLVKLLKDYNVMISARDIDEEPNIEIVSNGIRLMIGQLGYLLDVDMIVTRNTKGVVNTTDNVQ